MLKIGDIVKVIKPANNDGEFREYIKIGTICCITEIGHEKDGTLYYGLVPIYKPHSVVFYYVDNEIEFGHVEWVKD